MNPKEQAERIVACFVPTIRCVINDYHDNQKEFVKEGAKQCAIIALERSIEHLKIIRRFMGLDISWIEKEIEVLKAIKNMK